MHVEGKKLDNAENSFSESRSEVEEFKSEVKKATSDEPMQEEPQTEVTEEIQK